MGEMQIKHSNPNNKKNDNTEDSNQDKIEQKDQFEEKNSQQNIPAPPPSNFIEPKNKIKEKKKPSIIPEAPPMNLQPTMDKNIQQSDESTNINTNKLKQNINKKDKNNRNKKTIRHKKEKNIEKNELIRTNTTINKKILNTNKNKEVPDNIESNEKKLNDDFNFNLKNPKINNLPSDDSVIRQSLRNFNPSQIIKKQSIINNNNNYSSRNYIPNLNENYNTISHDFIEKTDIKINDNINLNDNYINSNLDINQEININKEFKNQNTHKTKIMQHCPSVSNFNLPININNQKQYQKDIINKNNLKINNNITPPPIEINNDNVKKVSHIRERTNSEANIFSNNDELTKPNYIMIFNDMNIFNSILVILSNLNSTSECLEKKETKYALEQYLKKDPDTLGIILYSMHHFIWDSFPNGKNLLSEKDIFDAYNYFVKKYSSVNNTSGYEDYCKELKNSQLIVEFIYSKINKELSKIQNINNNNYVNIYDKDSVLKNYIEMFQRNNNSFISDNFIGFYQNKISCEMCCRKYQRYGSFYNDSYSFDLYYDFVFNLNEILNKHNNMIQQMNNLSLNNNTTLINKVNLYDCFDYNFFYIKPSLYNCSFCEQCRTATNKYAVRYILSLPNIVTIVLNNNTENNIIIEYPDKLDLTKYTLYKSNDDIFSLVGIISKIHYNKKFICYSINRKNGIWYSYEEGKIEQVNSIDINAIPLILIYQKKCLIKFGYQNIERNYNNVLLYKFRFGNNVEVKMFIHKNMKLKSVFEKLYSCSPFHKLPSYLICEGRYLDAEKTVEENNININSIIVVGS